MNEHPFTALLELVQFDQAINHLNSQIAACKEDISTLTDQLLEADNIREDSAKKVRDYKKLVDEQELIMKEIAAQERDKKNVLNNAASYKEMMALQSEIAMLQGEQEKVETQLLDVWNKLDAAQRELSAAEHTFAQKKADIDALVAKRTQEIAGLQKELDAKLVERKPLEVKVPDEWREKYSIMKARVANPIVPVKNNSCTACYYTMTSQELVRLRNRALLQCQQCFRLLYSEEAMSNVENK